MKADVVALIFGGSRLAITRNFRSFLALAMISYGLSET